MIFCSVFIMQVMQMLSWELLQQMTMVFMKGYGFCKTVSLIDVRFLVSNCKIVMTKHSLNIEIKRTKKKC